MAPFSGYVTLILTSKSALPFLGLTFVEYLPHLLLKDRLRMHGMSGKQGIDSITIIGAFTKSPSYFSSYQAGYQSQRSWATGRGCSALEATLGNVDKIGIYVSVGKEVFCDSPSKGCRAAPGSHFHPF